MKRINALLLLILASPAIAQAPLQRFTDAAALLDAVAKTYAADAQTFHFHSITETVQKDEWQKSERDVIKAAGNRFRIEARDREGTWIQQSDGTTEWVYVREAKMYEKRPAGAAPQFPHSYGMGAYELKNAWEMRTFLDAKVEHAKGATMLPDETIVLEGQSYACYVVHATSEGTDWHSEHTFWIEKKSLLLRKEVELQDTFLMVSPILKLPLHQDVTTTYPVAEIASRIDPEVFAFTPPSDAKEVPTLEPAPQGLAVPASVHPAMGKIVPDIALAGADGKQVKLSSFRGSPLLIDVWATWCAACLEWMPSLGKLEKEMRGRGLRVISVDRDEVAENATHYMKVHEFPWVNYHDADGKLANALGEKAIPLTVLIDAEGRLVYLGTDSDELALRKAIAGIARQTVMTGR